MQRRTISRIRLLAIILLGCMAFFVVRLFWLQVVQHRTYVTIARQSQQRSFVIPAKRGEIYMLDHEKPVPVVLNQAVFTVIADPAAMEDADRGKVVAALREVAGGEMTDNVEARLQNKKSRYEVLARNITRSQAESLKKQSLSGVIFQPGTIRNYPEGQLAAQTLGFVNAEGKGQYGIEQGLNERLKGRDGLLKSVTDVRNVPLTVGKENVRIEPVAGENIVLSIDRNIQSYAESALKQGVERAGATEGSMVVMNPKNGQIMAMANYPSYSPAAFHKVKDASIFVNSATMIPIEPASIIKTFTMAVGIDKGVITPQSTYTNTDKVQVGDRTIGNAAKGHTGVITMQHALNMSLNTGTVTVGRRLGDGNHVNRQARQTLYEYFHDRFGLAQPTGVEVPEAKGMMHQPNSGDGDEVRYATMTFGQGFSATPLQVAAGFCSVVNGGSYYQPTLLAGRMDEQGRVSVTSPTVVRHSVSQSTSQQVQEMLVRARQSTAQSRLDAKGYRIGGKTGTAETVAASGAYTMDETVGTYVGFGGTDAPEYVIMIRVAAPGKGKALEGGTHAAPIFTDMSNWMINYLKLPPRG